MGHGIIKKASQPQIGPTFDVCKSALTHAHSAEALFFRPRRPGPELWLEDAVVAGATSLLPTEGCVWLGASLYMGMTCPDLTIVEYEPVVGLMSDLTPLQREMLAYLRTIARARINTIASRLQCAETDILAELGNLLDFGLLAQNGDCLSAVRTRCLPLREVVTVEAKVDRWRVAVQQAARNSVVATRSYVALPESTALRVRSDSSFARLGIGIIAVARDSGVTVVKRARRSEPAIWRYYYDLATSVGESVRGGWSSAIPCADRRSEGFIP